MMVKSASNINKHTYTYKMCRIKYVHSCHVLSCLHIIISIIFYICPLGFINLYLIMLNSSIHDSNRSILSFYHQYYHYYIYCRHNHHHHHHHHHHHRANYSQLPSLIEGRMVMFWVVVVVVVILVVIATRSTLLWVFVCLFVCCCCSFA